MNIFMENEDFLKGVTAESLCDAEAEFFAALKSVRSKLGRRQYWIDNYVWKVLEAINYHSSYDIADEGFNACRDLRNICTNIMRGKEDQKDHPLYPLVKDTLEKFHHYQEDETRRSLTILQVYPEFVRQTVKVHMRDLADSLSGEIDNLKLREDYNDISTMIGEEEMERLNYAIKRRFIIAPVMNIYLQGMTDDYLYTFLHQDRETSKLAFQLLLDEDVKRGLLA